MRRSAAVVALLALLGSVVDVAGTRTRRSLAPGAAAIGRHHPAVINCAPWEASARSVAGQWVRSSDSSRYVFTKLGATEDIGLDVFVDAFSTDGWILSPTTRSRGVCFAVTNKYLPFGGSKTDWCVAPATLYPEDENCMNFGPHEDLCRDQDPTPADI